MYHAYFFEARAIQRYILDGGRLADMVGASAIVDSLCAEPLDEALAALKPASVAAGGFARRAGATVSLFLSTSTACEQLRDLWSLVVPGLAPGLDFAHAVVSAASPVEATTQAKAALRSAPPRVDLPEAAHLVRRSPRTGLAAGALDRPSGEWMDASTERKRRVARMTGRDAVGEKFAGPTLRTDSGEAPIWTTQLDPDEIKSDPDGVLFRFVGDRRYVGIVHADGNSIGAAFEAVEKFGTASPDRYVEMAAGFSLALSEATKCAAQIATREALWPERNGRIVPARPIVLGGDDLTIIVRGDLALRFAARFLEAFETESERTLAPLRNEIGDLPERLTACAGVALVNAKYPFHAAYALAESMCRAAKKDCAEITPMPSGIVFGRVMAGTPTDYRREFLSDLKTDRSGQEHTLTLGTYGIGDKTGLPGVKALFELVDAIRKARGARGALRSMLKTVYEAPAQAKGDYQRWRRGQERTRGPSALGAFDSALTALGISRPAEWPGFHYERTGQTPLGDAFALLAMEGSRDDE